MRRDDGGQDGGHGGTTPDAAQRAFDAFARMRGAGGVLVDPQFRVVWAAPFVAELIGYTDDELVGRSAFDFLHPDDLARIGELIADDRLRGAADPGVERFVLQRLRAAHRDGRWIACEVLGISFLEDDASPGAFVVLRAAEDSVRLDEFLAHVAAGADVDTILSDVVAFCEASMPGARASIELAGTAVVAPLQVGPVPDRGDGYRPIAELGGIGWAATAEGGTAFTTELHHDGAVTGWLHLVVDARVELRPWIQQVVRRCAGLAELATARIHTDASLARAASHDALTELLNRPAFSARAELRRSDAGAFAVLYLDVDRFKETNDRYGHAAGDAVLVEVGRRLTSVVRDDDVVSRFGGDEFVAYLGHLGDRASAEEIAERVLRAVCRPVATRGGLVDVGVSVGLAVSPGDAEVDDLVRLADQALYEAKAAGGRQAKVVLAASDHAPR